MLRWYTDTTSTNVLYEEFFHCHDLGVQLKPVLERFKASEACLKRIPPAPGAMGAEQGDKMPIKLDDDSDVLPVVKFQDWVKESKAKGDVGDKTIMEGRDFDVVIQLGNSKSNEKTIKRDVFIWQKEGSSEIEILSDKSKIPMQENSIIVLPPNTSFVIHQNNDGTCMKVFWEK
eukprot:TRINITY_DN1268_c0_g2_i1.p1 TRINITY_DN1268_c0_g2~~TRINITY_DN1268_c0_g2_i1.p1  ORF type:complete len:174 (-),score=46.50 TRINITY_DN1268_c0_g2_i1:88-609(-)